MGLSFSEPVTQAILDKVNIKRPSNAVAVVNEDVFTGKNQATKDQVEQLNLMVDTMIEAIDCIPNR